jgi:hypothetical protein
MESTIQSQNASQTRLRPVRVAIIYDDAKKDSITSLRLGQLQSKLGVNVVKRSALDFCPDDYDVVGVFDADLKGESAERTLKRFEGLKIGFVSPSSFNLVKNQLKYLDASLVCGKQAAKASSAIDIVYYFFESLLVPSLFNIDLADVRAIAKGVGLSRHESGDSTKEIVSKLPAESYVAKSALLHFSCSRDVTLQEVYDVSRAISLKRPEEREGDEKRDIRQFNVKMGLRFADEQDSPIQTSEKRISLTAILFGLP